MKQIKTIIPLENFMLLAEFTNGEKRIKDISRLFDKPIFAPLKDRSFFMSAFVGNGAVVWKDSAGNEIDICPDTFYLTGKPMEE